MTPTRPAPTEAAPHIDIDILTPRGVPPRTDPDEAERLAERERDRRSDLVAIGMVFLILTLLPLYMGTIWKATSFLDVTTSGDMNVTVRTMTSHLGGSEIVPGVVTAAGHFNCGNHGPTNCAGATITVVTRGLRG